VCRTEKELLSKIQATGQALTSLANRGWQVTESPAPGAFALGDYLHLKGPPARPVLLTSVPKDAMKRSVAVGDVLSEAVLVPDVLKQLQLDPVAERAKMRVRL
jgi:hypothetical protein